eukprot:PITA_14706
MDFITGLPKSGNKSVIKVVVDRLSKYAHFCALPHPFTPTFVAQSFMDQIFKLHGMPTSIVSDRDPIFTNNFWQELFRLQAHRRSSLQASLASHCKNPSIFHVSCLKKVVGNNRRIQTSLPELDEEGSIWLQPEQVLDTRKRHLRGYTIKEVLVEWKDTSPENATWELATVLQRFSQLQP